MQEFSIRPRTLLILHHRTFLSPITLINRGIGHTNGGNRMDSQLKELIDLAKTTFGLNHYYLQRYEFYRSVNTINETVYTLSMEWFPNHITVHEDDETNPNGAAGIEINVKSRKFTRAIFAGGISYAEDGVKFSHLNMEAIIKWIEDKTGLMYGIQKENKKANLLLWHALMVLMFFHRQDILTSNLMKKESSLYFL